MTEQRFFASAAEWCTSAAGWRSLHLRQYHHAREVEDFETPPALDQVVVLVTKGSTLIESFRAGRWRSAAHVPGNVGMTAPGERARLRWRGPACHETLQMHIPTATLHAAIDDAKAIGASSAGYPAALSSRDEVIAAVMRSLVRAADEGAPELFAASAAHFLARHLIARHPRTERDAWGRSEDARVRRVEEFMKAHLSADLDLGELAAVAGCSTFQLIRICKAHWGQTPFQRLTRLRMDAGRHLLLTTDASVISIALDCGYANPSHFATAFRRVLGLSPSDCRRS